MNGINNSVYQIQSDKKAKKYLKKLPQKIQKQIKGHVKRISENPLSGYPLDGNLGGKYAIDSGEYRIIYKIYREIKIIVVLNIGPRGDIYKK